MPKLPTAGTRRLDIEISADLRDWLDAEREAGRPIRDVIETALRRQQKKPVAVKRVSERGPGRPRKNLEIPRVDT